MKLELEIPDNVRLDERTLCEFRAFLQGMVNRRVVGALRYGDKPNRKQRYMSRLGREFKAYRKGGNFENLLNVANYAFLESAAPENRKLHFDPSAASATRAEFGAEAAV